MPEFAGYKWLSEQFEIVPIQPFFVESVIATARRTVNDDGRTTEKYPNAQRPAPTIEAHLTFSFRYEPIHLEFLARLFAVVSPEQIAVWIRREPTGQYARRTGFLYEWLTGRPLDVPDTASGNYVDAINPEKYLVSAEPVNNLRWRVRDNMPGNRHFCPVVLRTARVHACEAYDCARALRELEGRFGTDLIQRSAVWLTVKESRASFAIEREEKDVSRVQRFAAVMEQRCGKLENPLSVADLTALQRDILGRATRYGVRRSPVFVGHISSFAQVVDYIAPNWDDTSSLLEGLEACMRKTRRMSPLVRAAVASFGFVFIHPMADGNGRISRFLINDVLRRDGAVPAPFILPVSATITHSASERVDYDRTLERFSRPLMQRMADRYRFGEEHEYEDGIRSNFHFDAYDEILPAWRYQNLTDQVEYLGHVIQLTIEREMTNEALYLRDWERAREAVKNYLEGPDADIDAIIRSIRDAWVVSGKLRRQFPQLEEQALASNIISALKEVFEPPTHDTPDNEID
jgi:hypothetical protein